MAQQSYSNHRRYVPGFHFATLTLILLLVVLSIINLVQTLQAGTSWIMGVIPVITALILIPLLWYCRSFAVAVQNRTVRAEENFRHYVATGKPLDTRLTMGQVIALRFAGDDEYLSLAGKAINEKMSSDDIKKAIRNRRADDYRC